MAFHEVRFPDDISRGARGGPERRTQIVELASGDEERNASWADSRRRYDAAYGIRRADDLAAVIAFFEARNGRLHGFRWKDWGDHKSGLPSTPVDADRPGARHRRRRHRGVPAGEALRERRAGLGPADREAGRGHRAGRARRRRAALRLVGRRGTGVVTFAAAPAAGVLVTAGFEFDVPVRFDTDRLDVTWDLEPARLDRLDPARGGAAMNEEPGFVAGVLRDLAASTAAILAAWGALGGATNALTTRMRLRDAVRHILLGGIIAAGMGSFSMALVARWLGLPAEAVPAGGAAGSAAYLVGVFGPAVIEVTLARIRGMRSGERARCVSSSVSRPDCAATMPIRAASSATACGLASPSPP